MIGITKDVTFNHPTFILQARAYDDCKKFANKKRSLNGPSQPL